MAFRPTECMVELNEGPPPPTDGGLGSFQPALYLDVLTGFLYFRREGDYELVRAQAEKLPKPPKAE